MAKKPTDLEQRILAHAERVQGVNLAMIEQAVSQAVVCDPPRVRPAELTCRDCGKLTPRNGAMQKMCPECSAQADLRRKRVWARKNPANPENSRQHQRRAKSRARQKGIRISEEQALNLAWPAIPSLPLIWTTRFAVPFTYACSKNHIYSIGAASGGHVALRKETKAIKEAIALKARLAVRDLKIVQAKLWIDILVQKPDHRGDAVNVIDVICDGVKVGVGLDDRWFCIRRLDWQIVKQGGHLVIGLSQDTDQDHQVCSYCGRILTLDHFSKKRTAKLGVSRECKTCLSQNPEKCG